jgi:hypothetical protein
MNAMTYEATVVNGQIRLPEDVHLPEKCKVLVTVPGDTPVSLGRIYSPRLAHPEQAAEFHMDVREISDAGV